MRMVLFMLAAMIAACGNHQSNKKFSTDSSTIHTDNGVSSKMPFKDFTKDSVFTITLSGDSSSTTVLGRINGINKPVTVNIPVAKGNKLTIVLSPKDSIANIRINQAFMPDGKADGPFGRRLEMKVKQAGIYKIIIGENLMQGEEWKGKFQLTVKIE